MATTTNYVWTYPSENEDPWFTSFVTMITSIDAEMYIRTKNLFMGGFTLYGASSSAANLLLSSTSHGTKGKVYFGATDYFDETNRILYMGTVKGGVLTGGNLTLSSTNHATKGKIYFGATDYYDEVNSVLNVTGFKMTTDAAATYVLTSSAAGVGTWQASAPGLKFLATPANKATLADFATWADVDISANTGTDTAKAALLAIEIVLVGTTASLFDARLLVRKNGWVGAAVYPRIVAAFHNVNSGARTCKVAGMLIVECDGSEIFEVQLENNGAAVTSISAAVDLIGYLV